MGEFTESFDTSLSNLDSIQKKRTIKDWTEVYNYYSDILGKLILKYWVKEWNQKTKQNPVCVHHSPDCLSSKIVGTAFW